MLAVPLRLADVGKLGARRAQAAARVDGLVLGLVLLRGAHQAGWLDLVLDHPQPPAPSSPSPPVHSAAPEPPPDDDPDSDSMGSGFFVTQDRLITAAHVVQGCDDVVLRLGRFSGDGHVVARDDDSDLALMSTAVAPKGVALLRIRPMTGEAVSAFGFPLADMLSTGGTFSRGTVDDPRDVRNDMLRFSAAVQPGSSGGPVLDENAHVVGLVDQSWSRGEDRQDREWINFAVRSDTIARFLKAEHLPPPAVETGTALRPTEIAAQARNFTVMILCLK